MTDEAFHVYQKLFDLIHDLIDDQIDHLSDGDQQEVREHLADEFRFWKRWADD